jgi:hypothetical protein
MWKFHFLGAFLGFNLYDDYSQSDSSYKFFIETFLYYQRLFEYGGSIESVLEMPYCLYNDIILEQIKLKKKELDIKTKEMDRSRGKQGRR